MRPDDIETVSAIENRAYVFPWTPGIFRDCLRAGHHCWVLEAGSTLLGYGVLSAAAGEAHILNICIAPEFLGQGQGLRLLRRLVDLARWHHAEQVFRRAVQGISLTIIRPGYFYHNLLEFVDMIKTMGILGANYGGSDRLDLVHPVDIAHAIAEEVLAPAESVTKVRYVLSDQRTCDEVASVLGAAISKPDLQWATFSDEETRHSLLESGMPVDAVVATVEFGAALHSGALTSDYGDAPVGAFGKTKLEDFARGEFAAAF